MGGEGISDYEKRRLARISDNKARLEALGLPHLASSFLRSSSSSSHQQQQKPRNSKKTNNGMQSRGGGGDDDEEEYRPSDDEGATEDDGDDDKEESSSEEDSRTSSCSRRKGKNMSSLNSAKVKRSSIANEDLNVCDIFDDEASLEQAIALSLKATIGNTAGTSARISQNFTSDIASKDAQKYKGKVHKSAAGRKKTRKLNNARVQLTEDEVVAYFFLFDETGKGYVTPRDVKRMASSHDFCWTDSEIAQMIHSFDNDGGGKLSLEDFRSIVLRCRMMQGAEES